MKELIWHIHARMAHDCNGVKLGRPIKAATKHAEDAAAMVALLGDDATVYHRGKCVWTEGEFEDGHAGDSFDAAAEVMHKRAGFEVD